MTTIVLLVTTNEVVNKSTKAAVLRALGACSCHTFGVSSTLTHHMRALWRILGTRNEAEHLNLLGQVRIAPSQAISDLPNRKKVPAKADCTKRRMKKNGQAVLPPIFSRRREKRIKKLMKGVVVRNRVVLVVVEKKVAKVIGNYLTGLGAVVSRHTANVRSYQLADAGHLVKLRLPVPSILPL